MITFSDILLEEYTIYKVLIRVTHTKDYSATELADVVRSIKGVTIVKMIRTEEGVLPKSIFSVKLRTSSVAKKAFQKLKSELLAIQGIRNVDIAYKTLEKSS